MVEVELVILVLGTIHLGLVEAGGSGFVWTSNTESNVPSGYNVSTDYYLTDAFTISGDSSFESITGQTEIGHEGNGYAKITWVGSVQ